jgi:catechol 2,3-dioxygenase-like lactoylglutathione lyase family enzyme
MNWLASIGFAAALATASAALAGPPPPPLTANRLGAVHIAVQDYDRSAAFYRQFGMEVGVDYGPEERQLKWSDLSQGSEIIMMKYKDPAHARLQRGAAALTFAVPDIHALAARLEQAGFDPGAVKDAGPYLILLLTDPDGNRIEVGQPTGKPTPW